MFFNPLIFIFGLMLQDFKVPTVILGSPNDSDYSKQLERGTTRDVREKKEKDGTYEPQIEQHEQVSQVRKEVYITLI